jgi:hypothetical protein
MVSSDQVATVILDRDRKLMYKFPSLVTENEKRGDVQRLTSLTLSWFISPAILVHFSKSPGKEPLLPNQVLADPWNF